VRHTHTQREKEWSGRSRERNTVGRVAVGGVWWVRVSYDCEHQKNQLFSLSPVCTRDCRVYTRRTRWKRLFYLVGLVLVIGETRRESVAAASILWVVVCVVVCVLLCVCRKVKNCKPHGALFRFSWREFS
jgi:hypothetical protein